MTKNNQGVVDEVIRGAGGNKKDGARVSNDHFQNKAIRKSTINIILVPGNMQINFCSIIKMNFNQAPFV